MQSTQVIHSNGQNQFMQTQNGQMIISQTPQYGNQVFQSTQPHVVSTTQQGVGQQTLTVMNSQPTPVIYQNQQYNNKYDNFAGCASIGLGITQLVIGILCIIMGIVAFAAGNDEVAAVGHGFWNGVFFIVTGSIGIAAGYSKVKCPVVAFLCLNIIAASVFAPALIIASSVGFGVALTSSGSSSYYYFYEPQNYTTAAGAEGTMLCLAILEFIISIISAAVCCQSACCCGHSRRGVVWPVQYMTVGGNGQQGYPAGQHPQVVVLQTPTMTGGQSGVMYVQPGTSFAAQPAMMQQPPAYTNQVPTYESQIYTNPPEMAQATGPPEMAMVHATKQ